MGAISALGIGALFVILPWHHPFVSTFFVPFIYGLIYMVV